MFLPELKYRKLANPIIINQFGGLNRSETITDSEFSDMLNVSGRKYPFLASGRARKKIYSADGKIECALPLGYGDGDMTSDDFCGIIDGYFYYKNKKKSELKRNLKYPYPYDDPIKYPQFGGKEYPHCVVLFNGTYIIFPSAKVYDPATNTLKSLVAPRTLSYAEFESFYYPDKRQGASYAIINSPCIYDNSYNNININLNHFGFITDKNCINAGDRITVWYDVSSDEKPSCNSTTVDTSSPELRAYLTSQKSFRPCSALVTNVTKHKDSMDNTYVASIECVLYDVDGDKTRFDGEVLTTLIPGCDRYYHKTSVSVQVSKYMPQIVYACSSGGRVWGLDPYGTMVYASALGDASSWSDYDGSGSAPWFTEVGSPGEWTAICEYNGSVYCFKRDLCHIIYGDMPSNFALARTIKHGCIDNRSIQVIGSTLYFLSSDGFYVCSGSQAIKISEKLGKTYTEAVSGCLGTLYYVSAKSSDGWELLCYDTEKNVWWREDDLKAAAFYTFNSKLYIASEKEIFRLGEGNLPDEWSVTSKLFDDGTSSMRSLCSLLFRLNIPAGADVTVYVSYDGVPFEKCGFVTGGKLTGLRDNSGVDIEEFNSETLHRADASYYQRFPIRFRPSGAYRFKLVCHGDVTLEAYERTVSINGKNLR